MAAAAAVVVDAAPLWRTGMVSAAEDAAPAGSRDLTQRFNEVRRHYRGGKGVVHGQHVAVESAPPLGWVQAVAKVEHAEGRITRLLRDLDDAQQEHLRARAEFDAGDSAEVAELRAKSITADVIKLFKQLDVAIHRIVQDPDDSVMLGNVQHGLAHRVNTLHSRFQALTDRYDKQLKRAAHRESRTRQYAESDALREWEEQDQRDVKVGKLEVQGFSRAQIDSMLHDEAIQAERARELANIAEQVDEIHAMFKDLNALVIDQGTMLDTVEANISQTRETVRQGTEQLRAARKHQKKCSIQ
eukprot:TRINITY_DN46810_c0_g1_i1.p2 TRINITY_DN46810_c0_g1~~TRINITY_DN46810_c0_g1_i1.p2  ORF type:complete len:300 (+),score=97.29 TRINITY_DN46810_c0_g1_i1:109-1008(+)